MDYKKIASIIEMVDEYALPLAEQGVKLTKTPDDDLAVAFFAGGLPALKQKMQEILPSDKKMVNILNLVITYILPLAREGVKMTKTPDDDLFVSLLEGGLPALQKKLLSLATEQPTTPTSTTAQPTDNQPKPTVTTTHP